MSLSSALILLIFQPPFRVAKHLQLQHCYCGYNHMDCYKLMLRKTLRFKYFLLCLVEIILEVYKLLLLACYIVCLNTLATRFQYYIIQQYYYLYYFKMFLYNRISCNRDWCKTIQHVRYNTALQCNAKHYNTILLYTAAEQNSSML